MSYTMIFKAPGKHRIHGYDVDYQVVSDSLVAQNLEDGWSLTAVEAGKRHADGLLDAVQAERDAQEQAVAAEIAAKPPTREELEQKAQQLGLSYGPRVSDKKLRQLIDAAIASDPKEAAPAEAATEDAPQASETQA